MKLKITQRDPSTTLRSARDDGAERAQTTTEILKKIRALEIKTRGLVETAFAGDYHSVFKGRGMNFEDVREYQPGDEIRKALIARGPNPLASICGRVCGAPCEAACRRGSIDQPIAIRALKAAERLEEVHTIQARVSSRSCLFARLQRDQKQ